MLVRGDARSLPFQSHTIDCVVTSPPYFGLRDYGDPQQVGVESTPEAYVETLVEVFREVRRVLKDDGTVWLNLGDSYGRGERVNNPSDLLRGQTGTTGQVVAVGAGAYGRGVVLPNKQLIGIPWRVALALQADGWYLRSDIIWSKPNPMPESVTDRPTRAHEYLFLLTKSPRYYYDAEAIKERVSEVQPPRRFGRKEYEDAQRTQGHAGARAVALETGQGTATSMGNHFGRVFGGEAMRNKRSVWTITTQSYDGAHFATMPEALVSPCILAGTSKHGYCRACGLPWVREVARETYREVSGERPMDKTPLPVVRAGWRDPENAPKVMTVGWSPSCDCGADTVPGLVLDPFVGSGTVVEVAQRLGRIGVGVDLSYHDLAKERTAQLGLRF